MDGKQEKTNQLPYQSIKKVLNDKSFYGFTAKRDGDKIAYTYLSVKWSNHTIKVLTTKAKPKDFLSEKIVLGIKIDENEMKNFKNFIDEINRITKGSNTKTR